MEATATVEGMETMVAAVVTGMAMAMVMVMEEMATMTVGTMLKVRHHSMKQRPLHMSSETHMCS